MSGTCKDCRFWDNSRYDWADTGKSGWGYCELVSSPWEGVVYESNAGILDGTSDSLLVTAPDFGCNQFEAKES